MGGPPTGKCKKPSESPSPSRSHSPNPSPSPSLSPSPSAPAHICTIGFDTLAEPVDTACAGLTFLPTTPETPEVPAISGVYTYAYAPCTSLKPMVAAFLAAGGTSPRLAVFIASSAQIGENGGRQFNFNSVLLGMSSASATISGSLKGKAVGTTITLFKDILVPQVLTVDFGGPVDTVFFYSGQIRRVYIDNFKFQWVDNGVCSSSAV